MVNFTTTETSMLAKLTQRTRAAYEAALRIRKRDYDGFIPPEVVEMRKLKEKVQEHDGILEVFKRGILQVAGGIGKKK